MLAYMSYVFMYDSKVGKSHVYYFSLHGLLPLKSFEGAFHSPLIIQLLFSPLLPTT